ncbi:PDDEXK nuclease domain-containing protein [Rhizobium mongolense]|uniref:Putative nuclease of restriction endonuclease-like (RecB) superfamily n=1 Tax=Rhizobium mongolense TaxID=57676 RepID=A0A7W6RPU0_9HYPH|nr:PDDEXK nuclease domain-containing protein [Rhizobium mongolense]MBB4276402.1 putative nuclease of restriction endonuclease-like (RecB) superfamily [Rhizobium mongolense]
MITPIPSSDGSGYASLLAELKERIRTARLQASVAINRELILLYWSIGREILARQTAEGWGARVIDRLAADLRRDFPDMTGLSPRNLKYMRAFAESFPKEEIVQQVVAQLPWGHNVKLVEALKDPAERLWYARQAFEHGWSRNVLAHHIASALYLRQGKALTNFARTLPAPQSDLAQELVKDPYTFDFLALGPAMSERELERGLLEHLRSLILELGKGFAFVGSQHHIEVGGHDYYLDLLFYHLRLRCFVVVELKIEDFKPEFAGKMNFYLAAVDDQLRHESDAPSIGIILCKGKNEVIVEYALRDSTKPMGVAEYRLSAALPAPLQAELPTEAEFAREFPLMSLVKLRIEVEREIRLLMNDHTEVERPLAIGSMLTELQRLGLAPQSMDRFRAALDAMNHAVHGLDVADADASDATDIATTFLAELRTIRSGRSS